MGLRNVATTPETHRRVNARPENAWARDLSGIFGWSRRFDPAIVPEELFGLMQTAEAIQQDGAGWRSLYRLSTLGEYAFLHSAYPTEAEDSVFFGPDTYRFVAAVMQELHATGHRWSRGADIGCGTGAAGICLALAHPDAQVLLTDINPAALRLSRINAALAECTNISTQRTSVLDGADGTFDLIVANPPYLLDAPQRLYRHGGGSRGEGLSLAILDTALDRLSPGGKLLLYTGSAIVHGVDLLQSQIVVRLNDSRHTWSYREIDPDVFGEELETLDADRIAAVFLSLTKVN